MSAIHRSGSRAADSHRPYPHSLEHSAAALWGDGFWGREQPNPEVERTGRKSASVGAR